MQKSFRNLLLLLQGQFVTNLGNQIYDIAMLLWLKELTGSAAVMGVAMLLTNLPEALFAPFGGKIADRYGRVRTMVTADLVAGAAVGLLVFVVWWRELPAELVVALAATNFVLGMAASCFVPAATSLVPELVEENYLERGNAAHQFCGFGARAIGQGAGGLLFAALGATAAFALNALSFAASAATEAFIQEPRRETRASPEKEALFRETLEMLRRVWRAHNLRRLVLYIAAFHLFVACLPVSLPFYAEHIAGVPDKWFGFFVGAFTLGVLGGFVVAGVVKAANRFRLIAALSAMVGAFFLVTGLVASAVMAWIALFGVGLGIGVIVVNLYTELQLKAPETERGGIMGAAHAVGNTTFPVGMGLTGLAIEAMYRGGISYGASVRGILIVAGVASMLLGLAAVTRRQSPRI